MNPKPNQELIKLSDLCWQFRKDEGYVRFHLKAPPDFIKVYHRSGSDVMFT